MKKITAILFLIFVFSCKSTSTTTVEKPLYEVLTEQSDGGGNIRFYEILTESNEIKMLENDEKLKRKIKPDDIKTSNFIILNMGEKKSDGYLIKIKNVEETADKIIVTVMDQESKNVSNSSGESSFPYTIVKINSKKGIIIR